MKTETLKTAIELAKMLEGVDEQPADFGSIHKIVICQRGFVYAGDVKKDGDYLTIEHAVNIRRWGTTKGLGELAESGCLPETKADAVGVVRVHELAVVAMIDCKEWIRANT